MSDTIRLVRELTFKSRTGLFAPGMDVPAARGPQPDIDQRCRVYEDWCHTHANTVDDAIRHFRAVSLEEFSAIEDAIWDAYRKLSDPALEDAIAKIRRILGDRRA